MFFLQSIGGMSYERGLSGADAPGGKRERDMYDVLVIGGGASGLASGLSAARAGAGRVAVVERQARVGKKLLATGNGRCNLYHYGLRAEEYAGDRAFIRAVLGRFDADAFFASLGLPVAVEENGCAYPGSNQASAVLDCLRLTAGEAGVEEICEFDVSRLEGGRRGWRVWAADGRSLSAARVIVAAGGMAAPKLGGSNAFRSLLAPLGHTFTPCLPALTRLCARPSDVAGLKGLRCAGTIALSVNGREVSRETGELLFAEDGVSGIAAMQLSMFAAEALRRGERVEAHLNVGGGLDAAAVLARARRFPERALEEFLTGVVPKRIGQAALKRAGVAPLSRLVGSLSQEEAARAADELSDWVIPVTGLPGFDAAQVMLGGVKCREFCPETLESKLAPGLYACGELFDATGPCGGYNLAWAWASGCLAGRSAAKPL